MSENSENNTVQVGNIVVALQDIYDNDNSLVHQQGQLCVVTEVMLQYYMDGVENNLYKVK